MRQTDFECTLNIHLIEYGSIDTNLLTYTYINMLVETSALLFLYLCF